MKHPADTDITDRKISDYFPLPGITLLLASLTWAIFAVYFVAMLRDHCHRVKEARRLRAIKRGPQAKDEVGGVDKQATSLRNSLRNPLLPDREKEKVKSKEYLSKEHLSQEATITPEKVPAEKTEKTDKNVIPSAEIVTPSKEVVKDDGGDIKPSAELTKPDNPPKTGGGGEARVSPSAEMISPSAEALNSKEQPKSDGVALTFSEMMRREKRKANSPSAEPFADTPEGRAKQSQAQKTWQQVRHKPSAEVFEEKWREENLGGKKPAVAKDLSKEPATPLKKSYTSSAENIVVTASAEHM